MTDLDKLNALHERDERARAFVKYMRDVAAGTHEYRHAVAGPLATIAKAAVDASSTGNSSALLRASRPFLSLVDRQTVLGRVDPLNAPPYVPVPSLEDVPTAGWIAEG